MTNLQQFLRRRPSIILFIVAAGLISRPTLMHAQFTDQTTCSSGVVDYEDDGYDGGSSNDVEQSACFYYDNQAGFDSWVETDNDYYESFYSEYGYDNEITWGVGAEAQIYHWDNNYDNIVVADSGMNTGEPSAYAEASSTAQPLPAYYILQAYYSEEDQFNNWSGASGGIWLVMDFRLAPNLTVSTSGTPSTVGQPVTFTATISFDATGEDVDFFSNGWYIGSGTFSGSTATFTTSALSVGTYSITANYYGGSNYRAATSNTITQTVPQDTTTVTVSCSPNPANYSPNPTMDGAISICTASVRVGSRSVGGDGYVDFYYNGQHFGGGSLNQYGNISANAFNLCTMPAGSYNVVASYNSYDGYYNPASGSTTLIVQNTSPSPITYAPPPPGTTDYSYTITPPGGATGYAANGNLLSYTDWVNGTWTFGAGGYDSLNRLVSGSGTAGPYQGLQMSWSYDSFGNRTSESFGGSPSISLPTGTTAYYNANNQVTGGSLGYDPAGNVTADNANNYLYDGEGRICAVQDRTFGGMTQYIYDAEGTRVAKGVNTNLNAGCDTSGPTFTLTNTYVIGPSGEQLTETDGQGNWVHTNVFAAGQLLATYSYTDNSHAATDTYFALSDWLGTKRAVVSAGGCGTGYVGLPYGGDLTATNLPGFTQCPDVTEHHFTGKERDAESGNDYFGARYFGSSMGRWLSPDDFTKDTHVADPQSWNLYAYARNNPLRYIDPTGQNATVSTSCSTDSSGHQTCNVNISASIAIYAAQGSGISKDQMNAAAATMKSSIEGAWSGSFSQNGISYNVSTQVSVSVASNQDAAMSSGAQNVVGMTNGPIAMADGQLAGAYVNPKSSPGQTDTGLMDVHNVDNYAKHEFTHMLGVNDKPGDVLSNTDPQQRPNAATNSDFRWGVQEAVGLQQGSRDHFMNPLLSNSLLQKVIVGAPAPGQWWK